MTGFFREFFLVIEIIFYSVMLYLKANERRVVTKEKWNTFCYSDHKCNKYLKGL